MSVIEDFCTCSGLPEAQGILKKVQENINECSWIVQEQFAFSASLLLMSTIISRKVTFQGLSPNLYALNIAPSGSGKDACQKKLQEYLIDANAEHLLGAGDWASDAGITDSLANKPVQLCVLDECGGILRTVTSSKAEYASKMADVLAELYTSSNSKYLGRAVAEGVKGSCYRPNVNILGSTTPTGFQEGVSLTAIQKGLLGRFLIFLGDYDSPAKRVKGLPHLDSDTINKIRFWVQYKPEESGDNVINNITQLVTELEADKEANERLDEIFVEFDDLRRATEHTAPILPIISRLYQQMVKVIVIHACSRADYKVPTVNITDVNFGYLTIQKYYETIKEVINTYIHSNSNEKNKLKILNVIKESGFTSKRTIYNATRELNKRERDSILDELVDLGFIERVSTQVNNKYRTGYVFTDETEEITNDNRHNDDERGVSRESEPRK